MAQSRTKIFVWILVLVILVGGGIYAYRYQKTHSSQQQGSGISYKGQNGKTALDLLKSNYKVETQSFTGGEFVKSINGQTPDNNHFWAFYVNGQEATIGASQYVTKDGDTVEWKMKQINSKL